MCAAVHLIWVIRIFRRALKFMNPGSSLRVVNTRFAHVYATCLAPRSPDVNVERIKASSLTKPQNADKEWN